ncbi:MAG: hypothetical protein QMC74_00790 [Myxococcota bacterium]|jgi:hypothetical protein
MIRSEPQWKAQFAGLISRRKSVEAEIDRINPKGSRRKSELNEMLAEVDRQCGVLEDQADQARVPMPWRD